MASITLTGTLLDPTGEVAVGDQIRFTHRTTTGETIQFARSLLIIPPNGMYNFTLEFGLILVEYLDVKDVNYKNLGVVTVNGDTTATDLPALLNSIIPPTDAQLLLFQAILQDTEDARDIALAAAAQQTTLELIFSTVIHPAGTVLTLSGFTVPGDVKGAQWKLNGVVGQTVSQSPGDLGDALLNDGNGNQWELVPIEGTAVSEVNAAALGAIPNSALDSIDAFDAAVASGTRVVHAPRGGYTISRTLFVNRSTCAIRGDGAMDSIITRTGTGSAIVFAPSDPNTSSFLNGQGISNIGVFGQDNTVGFAIECIKCERFRARDIRWGGYNNGLLIQGGQFNSYSGMVGTSPGANFVAGSAAIRVEVATSSGGDIVPFTINILDFFITGGPNRRIDNIFDISACDGLQIGIGYAAFGRNSIMQLDPKTDKSIAALSITGAYFDGVFKSASGSDYGISVPVSTGTGRISAKFANCFIGQFGIDALNVQSQNAVSLVFAAGTSLVNSVGRGAMINGHQDNTKVSFTADTIIASNNAGGIVVDTARSIKIDSCEFDSNSGDGAVKLSGVIKNKSYGGNGFENNSSDVDDTATGVVLPLLADWYTKGNYTPVLQFGGGSTGIVYAIQKGNISILDKMCTVGIEIFLTSKGSDTGQATIILPFTAQSGTVNYPASVYFSNMNASVSTIISNTEDGSGSIVLARIASGSAVQLTDVEFNNDSLIRLAVTYEIA